MEIIEYIGEKRGVFPQPSILPRDARTELIGGSPHPTLAIGVASKVPDNLAARFADWKQNLVSNVLLRKCIVP